MEPIEDYERDQVVAELSRLHEAGQLDPVRMSNLVEVALTTSDRSELDDLLVRGTTGRTVVWRPQQGETNPTGQHPTESTTAHSIRQFIGQPRVWTAIAAAIFAFIVLIFTRCRFPYMGVWFMAMVGGPLFGLLRQGSRLLGLFGSKVSPSSISVTNHLGPQFQQPGGLPQGPDRAGQYPDATTYPTQATQQHRPATATGEQATDGWQQPPR